MNNIKKLGYVSFILFIYISGCAPVVVEEDMQKHISSMNETNSEIENIMKSALGDLNFGSDPREVKKKYNTNAKLKFDLLNKKLEDYVKYCDQQSLPDEVLDKYLEQIYVGKIQSLLAELKERGVEFDFE